MLVAFPVMKPNGTYVEVWEYLFTTKGGQGWFYGTAGITGVILSIILVIMIICSQPFVRKKGHFEVNVGNIKVSDCCLLHSICHLLLTYLYSAFVENIE